MNTTNTRFASLIAALLAATLLAPPLAADPQADRYYEDAVTRFDAGDLNGALVQLKNVLQRDPGQLAAKILMGRTLLALGRPREAEEEILQARTLGADPVLNAVDLARARNALGAYQKNLDEIIPTRYPGAQQADLWVELGMARLRTDDRQGAKIAFDKAVGIDPLHAGGGTGLARIPLEEKDYPAAGRQIDSVLAHSEEHADAWFIKGSALHAQGLFDEAAAAYARAVEIDPNHLEAALGEASATLENGQTHLAVAILQPLAQRYPAVATIPYLIGEAQAAAGNPEGAAQARAAASSLVDRYSPADIRHRPNKLLLFGTIAFDSGKLESAYKFLNAYVEISGSDVKGRKLLARTLLGLGKPAAAQKVLVRASGSDQADAELLALLGDTHVQLGDSLAADRYYRSALRDHNGGPAVVRRLAMTQFHAGRRDQALQTLQALIAQTQGPGGNDTSLLLGLLYFSEQRYDEAGAIAERLSKQNPQNLTARNLLALVTLAQGAPVEGRRMLEQILGEDADFKPARYNLIKLDIAEGNTLAASDALQAMLAQNPDDTRLLLEYARLAAASGNRRQAIQSLEHLREVEPGHILGNIELIDLYLAGSETAAASTRAIALDRLASTSYLAKTALARTQIAEGERTDAAITLAQAARLAADDPRRLLRVAKLQIQVNALADAAWSLTKLLATTPTHPTARIEMATVLFLQRKYDKAEKEAEAALAANPRNIRGLSLLADLRMAQQRYADAVTLYQRARAESESASLVISEHRALMHLDRGDEALQLLRDWHAGHPDEPSIMALLADHLAHVGDTEQSLALRQRLVKIRPKQVKAWIKLARALEDRDSEGSLKAALTAHALAPNDSEALDTLGWTFVQLGNLEEGLARLREAVARNGRSATARYHLGVALQEFGNPGAARQEFRRALALSDSFPEHAQAQARLEGLQ